VALMPVDNRPSPIFHVGLHKTGTTWFQKQFYPNVKGYRLVDRRLVRSTLLGTSPLAFDPAVTRGTLGLDDGDPPIVCEEDLSGVLHNGGLLTNYIAKEIAGQLQAIAPDARVVILVRNQVSMAASLYQQYVREGGTASVRRYLFPESYLHLGRQRPLKVPRFDFSALEYDRLIAHYDSLFGRDRVFAFAYEQFAREPDAFLADFCAKLGLEMPPLADRRRLNSSYRAGLLPIARALNLFTRRTVSDKVTLVHIPYWYAGRKALLQGLNRVPLFGRAPSAEHLLGRRIAAWIRQHFAERNRVLQERLGVDLAALGYALDPSPAPVERPGRSRLLQWTKN
jgi:hypothetical protein